MVGVGVVNGVDSDLLTEFRGGLARKDGNGENGVR